MSLHKATPARRRWIVVTLTLVVAAGWAVFPLPASAAGVFNVRDYGAAGNGTTNDTPAIDRAIVAANAAGGGTVQFPAGTYRSANTIHMLNNVTLQLDSGSTIMGASGTGYDLAEANPNSAYQDFGHSHFRNAMITGNALSNIGFVGSGTIDGGGFLSNFDDPGAGRIDKVISLTRCANLELSGITIRRAGHFAALINGCNGVHSDGLVIDTAGNQDGWNIVNTQNVVITNADIRANDDALVFKSDWALGQRFTNGHVRVTNSRLSAGCCNAIQFGSETCSDFSDYVFDGITITGANKAGLGMVTMDGANISDVHYRNITMSGVASPIFTKVGTRRRCGDNPGVGSVNNVTYEHITGTGKGPHTALLWGADSSHQVRNVTFDNVDLTVPGGSANRGTAVPSDNPNDYSTTSIGTAPSYGWYLHNVNGIRFIDSSVRFVNNDDRPAVIADAGGTVTFDHFTGQRGTGAPNDIRFQGITGYCVTNSVNTSGGALRVSQTGSTQNCGTALTISGLTVADTANATDWSVQPNLTNGVTQYADRAYTLGAVPSGLTGAQWIRTANDSKAATANPLVRFTVNRQATVNVAVDTRRGRLSWMDSSWTDTGGRITNNEGTPRTFAVFSKVFAAGQIALGPNGDSGNTSSMYTIIVT
ncbi:glycoside hydrolase family 28 protein [Dactylosporangium siamense]|nr:glycosyl hydrolase family 28 protein [Dactylosporangium siamense]